MTVSRFRRPSHRSLLALAAIALLAAGCLGSTAVPAPSAPSPTHAARASGEPTRSPATLEVTPTATAPTVGPAAVTPTLSQLVGQKLVVRMDGSTPDAGLLQRIQRGEVGGVILFGDDIASPDQLRALTAELHGAARNAGQPRLLVMTDQEGGAIRRIPWAPPKPSAWAMGQDGRTSYARSRGRYTGAALQDLGIDVDLAPVADVPRTTSSFMYLQRRTFSFDPATVTRLANAFALGLRDGGTIATMKHFPGLGRAKQNTDNYVVTIPAGVTKLQRDLAPYPAAIANGVPMVMLSNAVYPAWDPVNAAGWSRAIAHTLLRTTLGFKGVSITDSLTAAARVRPETGPELAVRAAIAGTDMILVTSTEASSSKVFDALLAGARSGRISSTVLHNSYARILALKQSAP